MPAFHPSVTVPAAPRRVRGEEGLQRPLEADEVMKTPPHELVTRSMSERTAAAHRRRGRASPRPRRSASQGTFAVPTHDGENHLSPTGQRMTSSAVGTASGPSRRPLV
ncbi:hypothetical protein I4F81_004877 [Pyropia yezoensis]|uniref:Uncharacterized protein n=1 Tax=Pyropia yezoensis TaxID=2788 RepID=A0ACC3BXG2_PYRYE|nr:hypothetical protein I4F81_004877 [Neopyropia yezoensis]